MKKVRNHCLRS